MAPKDLDYTLTFKLADESKKTLDELSKEQLEEAKKIIEKRLKDYEEPKEQYYIKANGDIGTCGAIEDDIPDEMFFKMEDIGNIFETEEEAKKAVEKQIIWTTLEDSGFKFTGWKRDKNDRDKLIIEAIDPMFRNDKDLDLLFGGEDA